MEWERPRCPWTASSASHLRRTCLSREVRLALFGLLSVIAVLADLLFDVDQPGRPGVRFMVHLTTSSGTPPRVSFSFNETHICSVFRSATQGASGQGGCHALCREWSGPAKAGAAWGRTVHRDLSSAPHTIKAGVRPCWRDRCLPPVSPLPRLSARGSRSRRYGPAGDLPSAR